MTANTAEELIARLAQMRSRRTNFDSQWQEVKDLVWPDGADFITTRSPGEKTNLEILDMTTAIAIEQGAAALETFLTPRTQRWHRLVPTNQKLREIARVKEFFEQATDVLFQMRNSPRARFSSQMHEGWKSELAYGNLCIYVQELPSGGINYRYTHVGCTWIDVDADGIVDTVFYEYKLTAKAAKGRWKDKAPKCVENALGANSPFTEHTYLHAVFPNPDYEIGVSNPDMMAFKACEISIADRSIIESGGYHELPYMWGRYTVNPAEVYGRGPAMMMLPDIKTLQQMQRVFLRSGQKVADPPLLAADDGVLGRGDRRIKLASGKVTMGGLNAQGQALVAPLITGARLDLTYEMITGLRELIRKAFHLDFFEVLLQDRTQMTATEYLGRSREKGQLTSPIVGRQQSEVLGPLIQRELAIAQRQGKLPPMPPELIEAQGDYEIEYESDATRMQKSEEVLAFAKTFEIMAPALQLHPNLLEVFKLADSVRSVFEVSGGSARNLNSKAEYEQIEKAQAQAAQQAAQIEAVAPVTKGLRDVAAAGKDVRTAA